MLPKRAPPAVDAVPSTKKRAAFSYAPDHFAHVPTDVLRIIFAHIHLRPRLLAVSPVCKRWRTTILRAIKDAKVSLERAPQTVTLSHLPSISSVELCTGNWRGALSLPLQVRTVLIVLKQWLGELKSKPPALSYFALDGRKIPRSSSVDVWPFLSTSRISLTALRLNCDTVIVSQFNKNLHFPSLTSLEVSMNFVSNATRDLLAAYCSQLRELSLVLSGDGGASSLTFPALRKLLVTANLGLTPAALATLLRGSPHLTELTLREVPPDVIAATPCALLSSLVALRPTGFIAPPTIKMLSGLSFFKRLELPMPVSNELTKYLIKVLTELRLDDSDLAAAILADAPALRKLSVVVPLQATLPLLPHLRELSIIKVPANQLVTTLLLLLRASPQLHRLTISIPSPEVEAPLSELLLQASLYTHQGLCIDLMTSGLPKTLFAKFQAAYKSAGWMDLNVWR